MPTIAQRWSHLAGKVVGNGHCVAFVREVTGLPATATWRRGVPVQGSDLDPGTAIATFNPTTLRYENDVSGRSHAAILIALHDDGSITVFDQWLGQPVHQRVIRNRRGQGDWVNDASRFFSIELAETASV